MEISRTQFFIYVIVAQIAFGMLIGLIPFFLGRSRKDPRMGNFGLIASILAGILSPLASIIVVAVFSWLIVRKKNVIAAPDEFPADNS
jgi:hypothetical protein